ncbi:MAG: hypothetical protein ABI359_09870 [Ginsengibacter sp.]
MEEKELSEKESLALISSMISKAKNHYYESGFGPLLWGFTNVICFTLAYMDATLSWFKMPFDPFYLMALTFMLQFYFGREEKKFKNAVTYEEEAHKYVWMAFTISLFILIIVNIIIHIGYFMFPLFLLLFAIPTFISGCISKFKPFIFGGIACWILCIISFLHHSYFSYLLVALGAALAWIIPGFILRKRFYKNIAIQHNGI